jgi:hypothetical protein
VRCRPFRHVAERWLLGAERSTDYEYQRRQAGKVGT